MNDLLERLRKERPWCYDNNDQSFEYVNPELADEAVDEIERLRSDLDIGGSRSLAEHHEGGNRMIHPDQIPTDTIIKLCHDLGHFCSCDDEGFRTSDGPALDDVLGEKRESLGVEKAVKSFQSWRGLTEDGYFGPIVLEHHLLNNRRCGLPDIMARRPEATETKWGASCQRDITWSFDFTGLRFQDSAGRNWGDAWQWGIDFWEAICNILFVQHTGRDARIQSKAGRMSAGTMAWSELSYGDCNARLKQEFNKNMPWRFNSGAQTIGHEGGHALGWGHSRKRGNLMYPSQDDAYDGQPGPWDIEQAVSRYGQPAPKPEPTPPRSPMVQVKLVADRDYRAGETIRLILGADPKAV